jgi:hypothetical protein
MPVLQYQQNQVPHQNAAPYNAQPMNVPTSYPTHAYYPTQPVPTYAQLQPQGSSATVPSPQQQTTNTQTASSVVTSNPNKFDPLNFDPFA